MKFSLLQIKNNRPIYRAIFAAYYQGIKKHNIDFTLNSIEWNSDLIITCADTWEKVKPIFTSCKKFNIPYLTNYIGHFNKTKVLSIEERDRAREHPSDDDVIFCNLIKNGNHHYLPQEGERYKKFKIEIKKRENKGDYILIFQQCRPEYHRIKTYQGWINWFMDVMDEIKQYSTEPVVVRLHPNGKKYFAADLAGMPSLNSLYDDIIISENKSLEEVIKEARIIITLSSKISIQTLLDGKPTYSEEKYSPAADVFNTDLSLIQFPPPKPINKWFKDIVYSYWSLEEIADGTYIEYLKNSLLKNEKISMVG